MLGYLLGTEPDWVDTVARVILGIIFFAHGSQKMLGWFGGSGLKGTLRTFNRHLGLPPLLALVPIVVEFFGGIGLILGFLGRLDAAGIAITMLAAIGMVHGRYGLFLDWFGEKDGHGIEYHLLVIGLALVVIMRGSGAASLDYWLYSGMNI